MLLKIDEWQFQVDIDRSRAYNSSLPKCDCADCRNFYAAIDERYPELRPFLERFGIDVERPEELWCMEDRKEPLVYQSYYTVNGKIQKLGNYEIDAGHAHILPMRRDQVALPNPDCDRDDPDGYFVLSVMDIMLPWVLDEPMPDF